VHIHVLGGGQCTDRGPKSLIQLLELAGQLVKVLSNSLIAGDRDIKQLLMFVSS
jgi:hypothetical protein